MSDNPADPDDDRALLVLYATETGNSLDAAERIAREARRRRFNTRVTSMDDYPLAELINESTVLFVLSTTGAGQEPRPMAPLWNRLLRSDLPTDLFDHLDYAVFGLGDSSYENFNWAAKKLARRMESLGARQIVERGEGDDQHRLGIDGALDRWMEVLFAALLEMYPLSPGQEILPHDVLLPSRVSFVLAQSGIPNTSVALPSLPHHHSGSLVENRRLTAHSWTQDVRHFSIEFEQDIEYEPGDVALIYPEADPDDVNKLLQFLEWEDPDAPLIVRPRSSDLALPVHFPQDSPVTLRDILTKYVDISAIPRRSFFEWIRFFTANDQHKEKLEEFSTVEGQEDMYSYVQRFRRTAFEVLAEFKSVKIPAEYVFDVFPPMRPRMFSISSSFKMHPRQVQLCVAIVRYKTRLSTPRKGLCTTFLARLPVGVRISVGFQKGTMRLPEDASTPILCVGPGTGVAPMRALLEERVVSGASHNTLYFGCRSATTDHLYGEEWTEHAAHQALTYHAAFSRDPPASSGMGAEFSRTHDKVYVQDLLRRDAHAVWECIGPRGNGVVYIAGSANQMPKAVKGALAHAAEVAGGMSSDDARAYVHRLERDRRLFEEGWN